MTIPLTGTGGLFTRLGREIAGVNEFQSYAGTNTTRAGLINAQYLATDQNIVQGLYPALASNQQTTGWVPYINGSPASGLMQWTIVQMAADDNSNLNPNNSLYTALNYLIGQMIANSQSINQPTVGDTITAGGSNLGNGTFSVSLINAQDGLQFDYTLAETLTATCSNDSYLGHGGTAGQEPFTILGAPGALSQPYIYNWPQGSGTNLTNQRAFSPSQTNALVEDGDFEVWSGSGNNVPTDWQGVGSINTPGTTLFRASGANAYTGSYAAQFTGNAGGEHTSIRTVVTLAPATSYAFAVWLKGSTGAPAGSIQMNLLDATGTQLTDNANNAATVTTSLAGVTTSFAPITGFLRTPSTLKTTTQMIEIRMSTALANTVSLYIDHFGFYVAPQFYVGGPYYGIFSGSVPFQIGDNFSIAMTNSLGITSFARSLDRLFGLKQLKLRIPSSVSPSISDALIA